MRENRGDLDKKEKLKNNIVSSIEFTKSRYITYIRMLL